MNNIVIWWFYHKEVIHKVAKGIRIQFKIKGYIYHLCMF